MLPIWIYSPLFSPRSLITLLNLLSEKLILCYLVLSDVGEINVNVSTRIFVFFLRFTGIVSMKSCVLHLFAPDCCSDNIYALYMYLNLPDISNVCQQ